MSPMAFVFLGIGIAIFLGLSARWNWWRLPAKGIPILMYHKIGNPPAGSKIGKLWVSVDQFRSHLMYLKKHGYEPIHFSDLTRWVDEKVALPKKPVLITFDDGYKNNYENAFPLLKSFGFKAVLFVVTDAVGRDNFWRDPRNDIELPILSWQEIDELQTHGVEIASHTLTHPRLMKLTLQDAKREIFESRSVLASRYGTASDAFAYPYGNGADLPELQQFIRDAGYRWAVSVHRGKAKIQQNPLCMNRLFVRGDDTLFDFHLNMTRGCSRL